MARRKNKGGRPTKEQGPKLSNPEEIERLLVEGEVIAGPGGEAMRVWPTQRALAARFGVSPSLICEFGKKRGVTERRAALQAQLSRPQPAPPPAAPAEARAECEGPREAQRNTHEGPREAQRNTHEGPREAQRDASEGPRDTQRGAREPEKRPPGRPRRQDAPLIAFDELDRLLVFGEVQVLDNGKTMTVYPSYRALAKKYGVVVSVIADYARSHNTMKRRQVAALRVEGRKDDKLVELRSDALAVGEARLLAMIDGFLVRFEGALKEGRVRTDSAADVNTFVRLKQFIQGGADSRQEVRSILSLEALQDRYARAQRETESATPAMTGVIDVRAEIVHETAQDASVGGGPLPPRRAIADDEGDPNVSRKSGADLVSVQLRDQVRELVSLARELAEATGADPDDDELLAIRVLRAAARVESALAAHARADVAPHGAEPEEDEE